MALGERDTKNSQIQENRLVLSIDHNGKIVFFNKECEKLAGYKKNEALNRHILDFLIPEEHHNQWWKILDSAKQDQFVHNIELPWVTKNGGEVKASWAIAPVGDSDGRIGDIGLVGEIMPIIDKIEETQSINIEDSEEFEEDIGDEIERRVRGKKENYVLFQFKDKKLVFRKKPSYNKEKNNIDKSEKNNDKESPVVEMKYDGMGESSADSNIKKDTGKSKNSKIIEKEKSPEYIFNKYSHENLVKNYERYNKNAKYYEELETKFKELEEENNSLKSDLKSTRIKLTDTQKKLEKLEKDHSDLAKKNIDLLRNSVYFIFDFIGGKKKKEEFENMINQLERRKTALQDIENQLNEDKRDINESRQEFIKWREKLEFLEEEIEKRNENLSIKEEKVRKSLSFFIDKDSDDESKEALEKLIISDEIDENAEYHDILDKIPQSAAIIQRGILKQVNDSFIGLLGYDAEALLEKNLFDFVIPEGFSGIEKYYLKRLKGENTTSYETMFVAKDDSKIAVEVSTKPVFFKGEKAEIAVFKKLFAGLVGDIAVSVDDVPEKQVEEEEVKSEDTAGGEVKSDESAPVGDVVAEEARSEEVKSEGDIESEDSGSAGDKMSPAEIDAMMAKARKESAKDTTPDDKTPEKTEKQENTNDAKDKNEKKSDDDKEEYDDIVKKLKLKTD